MPEGDTVHTIAGLLEKELTGRKVTRVFTRAGGDEASLVGRSVDHVTARGKHMLIGLGPATLHVHLGMYGRWDSHPSSRAPRGRIREATVVIETDSRVHACFEAATAELLRTDALERHPRLSTLGPDLISEEMSWGELVRRARSGGDRSIDEVLMDQRVACGIGNAIRCELLFLERTAPGTKLSELGEGTIVRFFTHAAELLRTNVGRYPRMTRRAGPRAAEEDRTWVHGRHGRPCFICRTPIVRAFGTGEDRITWWCPKCQGTEASEGEAD